MCNPLQLSSFVFFFNATATSDIYTLSLHDALPICHAAADERQVAEGVERYEVDDRQRGLQRVIATPPHATAMPRDRKSTRLNSSHTVISYAVFCLKKKKMYRKIIVGILLFWII